MGPTYLVLLVSGPQALVLYDGTDLDAAQAAYDEGCEIHDGAGNAQSGPARIAMATCRSQTVIR